MANTYTPKDVSRDVRRGDEPFEGEGPEAAPVEQIGDNEVDLSDGQLERLNPDDPGFLSEVASDFRDLREVLDQPTRTTRGVVDPGLPTTTYMRRLRNHTTQSRDPEREDPQEAEGQTEWGAYLRDVMEEIKQARDVADTVVREIGSLDERTIEVICCILNGIYLLAETDDQAIEDFRRVRAISEDVVRDWIDFLLEMLRAYRAMAVDGGQIGIKITLLYKDITEVVKKAVEEALAGILMGLVDRLQKFADRVNEKVTDALEKTNCPPLVRIWAAVYDFVFGGTAGILARTMKFFQDVITHSAQQRRSTLALGASVEGANVQRVDDLIDILEAIRAAANLFDKCRVPEEPRQDREPREQIEDAIDDARDDLPTPGDLPGLPLPDPPDDEDIGAVLDGPESTNSARSRRVEDEDVGAVRELDLGRRDLLYLTPTNVAKMMVSEFGANPEEALDLARNRNCQDQLSEETADILREVGVIQDE